VFVSTLGESALNRRVVLIIAAAIGLLGGGYLGWLNWRASHSTVAQPPARVNEAQYEKFTSFFEDATAASGVDFQHWCGDGGKYFFPEVMGSGLALLDYNRDGKLDLFVVQGMPTTASASGSAAPANTSLTSRLYRQEDGGRFRDVTDEANLADTEPYGMGVAVGDVNNDGWPDLYISKYGADRLFLNREGKFEDITESSGIGNPRWGASAGFLDFDRDGWLDLFVTNYVDYYPSQRCIQASGIEDYCHPRLFADAPSRLFRNVTGESPEADRAVRFRDVSLESGIDARPGPGLGVLFEDFSGDDWPDILVANDSKANFLWVNRHDGSFAEEAIAAGAAYDRAGRPQANMGIACGDVDGNGLNDFVITHLDGEYDTLYLQLAPGVFEDRSIDAGLRSTIPPTGFGTVFGDMDLDGDLDLAIVNGRVRRPDAIREAPADATAFWQTYAERSAIFVNGGDGKFTEADPASQPFCGGARVSRGLAMGDLDDDGDLDLVTSEVNGPARIYRNVAPRQGSWLAVRAIEPALGGRDAYGAVIRVRAGKRTYSRTVGPASSYLSSSDPRVHFGLAGAKSIDAIDVRWPDGSKESFPGGDVDRQVTIEHGRGTVP
jgi:hypothetical protein